MAHHSASAAHHKEIMHANTCDGTTLFHQQQQRHISMGPCGAIDSSSCICQWVRTGPSGAAAAAYADGPMQSHRQQQLHMPMGPRETISSSSSSICRCGPREITGNSSSLFQWTHAKPSTAAVAYANGPMGYHWQQQLHIPISPHGTIGSNSCIC